MKRILITTFALIQMVLSGCGNKNNSGALPPQACGKGVPAQYCVPANNNNTQQGPPGFENSPPVYSDGQAVTGRCFLQDPNACNGTGSCQSAGDSSTQGYCVSNQQQ